MFGSATPSHPSGPDLFQEGDKVDGCLSVVKTDLPALASQVGNQQRDCPERSEVTQGIGADSQSTCPRCSGEHRLPGAVGRCGAGRTTLRCPGPDNVSAMCVRRQHYSRRGQQSSAGSALGRKARRIPTSHSHFPLSPSCAILGSFCALRNSSCAIINDFREDVVNEHTFPQRRVD